MKKIFRFALSLILVFSFANLSFAKVVKKKKVRSASSSSGLVSAKTKNKSLSSSSSSSSKKKSNKSSKKSKSSEEKDDAKSEQEDKSELSESEKCMVENLETLINGECKFLNDEKILPSLTNFYCIYNVKDKTKTESVYNYFLYQNYGIKETALKDNDVSVTIKNPSNGTLKGNRKYYEFLLDGLADNTLKDGRILDFLTEYIIDSNESLFANQTEAVQNISVETTSISMPFSKSDIENCKKATKKAIQTCGIANDSEIQSKIELSCSEYNSALMKDASDKKGKVLDAKTELAKVLLNRVSDVIDAQSFKTNLDEKSVELKEKQKEVENKKEELEKTEDESSKEDKTTDKD